MKSDSIQTGDALLIVDVQNDFLPGGSLAVEGGDEIIPSLNRYIAKFAARGCPVFLTRDWHPADHSSFARQGGPWTEHCLAETAGAEFAPGLSLPEHAEVVSKGVRRESEGYSGFDGTDLHARLDRAAVKRLFVAGLATDYCVLQTVLDALKLGYRVSVLKDAVRAVNLKPGDGDRALQIMRQNGALLIDSERLP